MKQPLVLIMTVYGGEEGPFKTQRIILNPN